MQYLYSYAIQTNKGDGIAKYSYTRLPKGPSDSADQSFEFLATVWRDDSCKSFTCLQYQCNNTLNNVSKLPRNLSDSVQIIAS